MKPYLKGMMGGWILCNSVTSLQQDAIGKEAYLRMANDGWISASITVPLAIFFGLLAIWLIAQAGRE